MEAYFPARITPQAGPQEPGTPFAPSHALPVVHRLTEKLLRPGRTMPPLPKRRFTPPPLETGDVGARRAARLPNKQDVTLSLLSASPHRLWTRTAVRADFGGERRLPGSTQGKRKKLRIIFDEQSRQPIENKGWH